MKLLRIGEAKAKIGYRSNTTVYQGIRAGLWTKPVRIGSKSSAWPEGEIDEICRARVAGLTNDQLRRLVDELHAKRVESFQKP